MRLPVYLVRSFQQPRARDALPGARTESYACLDPLNGAGKALVADAQILRITRQLIKRRPAVDL